MDGLDQMMDALDKAERALGRARHEVMREYELIRCCGDSETGQRKRDYVERVVADTATNVREILGDVLCDMGQNSTS